MVKFSRYRWTFYTLVNVSGYKVIKLSYGQIFHVQMDILYITQV